MSPFLRVAHVRSLNFLEFMMMKNTYTSLKSRLISSVPVKFLKNKDGIAAIEFGLIAPVMIFMYFGMAEVASAISVDRKVSHSANVAGDLTTQSEAISAVEMADILAATIRVMDVPTSTEENAQRAKLIIEIASYARDEDGAVTNMGTATLNGPFPTSFNADNLDDRILSDASGIVVARVSYNYDPLKLRYTSTNIDLNETFMLKPRKSEYVQIENVACTLTNGDISC